MRGSLLVRQNQLQAAYRQLVNSGLCCIGVLRTNRPNSVRLLKPEIQSVLFEPDPIRTQQEDVLVHATFGMRKAVAKVGRFADVSAVLVNGHVAVTHNTFAHLMEELTRD